MVQHSISHGRLVNAAHFRVTHPKTSIRSVAICFAPKFTVKFENILFKIPLERPNIQPVPFAPFKYFPCAKKIFWRNY